MPFTPSHAVVALPFVRTRLVPAAIAIGAMAPDLPLFLRGMVPDYAMTHEPLWLLPTTALALVLLLAWRCVLRPAVRELCPRWVATRLPRGWDAGYRSGLRETLGGGGIGLLWLLVSLALGVVTHIAWDLFTHEERLGVQVWPVLEDQWGPLPGVKWLQYASGVVGLGVLAAFALVWLSRRSTEPAARVLPHVVRVVWWISLPLALVGATAVSAVSSAATGVELNPTGLVYGVLTRVAAGWGVLTVALAIVVQVRRGA